MANTNAYFFPDVYDAIMKVKKIKKCEKEIVIYGDDTITKSDDSSGLNEVRRSSRKRKPLQDIPVNQPSINKDKEREDEVNDGDDSQKTSNKTTKQVKTTVTKKKKGLKSGMKPNTLEEHVIQYTTNHTIIYSDD